MEYIHVRNLEKYHPGYKDRTLQWAKIYFKMVQGDPDCELIENETDWGRLIKLIILELQAQKPLPNIDTYWSKKGFNIKKRPMSLTISMLHNFLEVVTQLSNDVHVDKEKEEDKDKSKIKMVFPFEDLWFKYPNKDGKKKAQHSFKSSVKTEQDWQDINKALENYLQSDKVKAGYIKNASTWFNNWRDWIDFKGVGKKSLLQRNIDNLGIGKQKEALPEGKNNAGL